MAPPSQGLEPPPNPARFTPRPDTLAQTARARSHKPLAGGPYVLSVQRSRSSAFHRHPALTLTPRAPNSRRRSSASVASGRAPRWASSAALCPASFGGRLPPPRRAATSPVARRRTALQRLVDAGDAHLEQRRYLAHRTPGVHRRQNPLPQVLRVGQPRPPHHQALRQQHRRPMDYTPHPCRPPPCDSSAGENALAVLALAHLAADPLPLTVPEVRRLLRRMVWTHPPEPDAALRWSAWCRRHQQRARRAHWHRRVRPSARSRELRQ